MLYILSLDEIGGLSELLTNNNVVDKLALIPELSIRDVWVPVLLVPLAVQWWASYYPGSEPGGGGYISQRMFSTKSNKDALKASLLFNIFHYAVRPWPWIITALCILFIYPITDPNSILHTDAEISYAYFMIDFIPSGLKGLLVIAFLSAFMSTVSTQINWGSSYIVNDFYSRFIRKEESFNSYLLNKINKIKTI